MKIVIVGPAYPYRGGNALFVAHLYEALSTKFEVVIINYTLLYPGFLFPGTTQYDQSGQFSHIPSRRRINSINPWTWWKTAKAIREMKPDLVVFDWWNPFFGPCHGVVARFLGKKFYRLFVTENVISHEGRWIDRILTKFGLSGADAFLSLSVKVEQDLKDWRGDRKVYRSELPIYDCYGEGKRFDADEERGKLGYPQNSEVLLFFGYVRPYKGLDVLLKAMPEIVRRRPNARLLIVGEFYEKPEIYHALIAELGIGSSVQVINRFVPNEEVGRYYAASDVVVLPYREATQSGILNVAYGFERPVIVTNVGGLSEFVDEGKTGFIVEPESPQALADGVTRFFEIGQRADFKEAIRRRSGSNAFTEIATLFQTILSERRV